MKRLWIGQERRYVAKQNSGLRKVRDVAHERAQVRNPIERGVLAVGAYLGDFGSTRLTILARRRGASARDVQDCVLDPSWRPFSLQP